MADAGGTPDEREEMRRLRLVIVDDNAQFLEAARHLLEREGASVVATTSNSADAERFARELHPDCVLVDIGLGAESGFDVAHRLVVERHQQVVMISVYNESEFADLIASSAAIGFIPKAELSVQRIAGILGDARGPKA
jgi:DNA-binding NarL/FixJ family response regulator